MKSHSGPESIENDSTTAASNAIDDAQADARLEQALREWREALDENQRLDRDAMLAKYSDIAPQLTECLQSLELVDQLVPHLVSVSASTVGIRTPILGDFRILRQIGCGGMGVVYEAEQISFERRVALKILPMAGMLGKHQFTRFQHEAKIAATLDHPHIVPIYSAGQEHGVPFIAMKLIDGRELSSALDMLRPQETYDPRRAESEPAEAGVLSLVNARRRGDLAEYHRCVARIGIQAAEALEYAHSHGVVHRDIKPGNLLLDANHDIWLTDFGLSRLEGETMGTATGNLLGTPRYMTPEQVRTGHSVGDPRADIYALGATLYELLTLEPVVAGLERAEILNRIVREVPRRPRAIDRTIPIDLETIVLKALEKEVDGRYQSAQAMADDLKRFLTARPILVRRPSRVDRFGKWIRRHKAVALSAMAVSLLLTLSFAISTVLVTRAHYRTQQSLAQMQDAFYVRDMTMAYQAWEKRWTDDAAKTLRRHVPDPGQIDRRGIEWHLLSSLVKEAPPLVLRGHVGAVNEVAVFPGGGKLASVGDDGIVRIWDVVTGQLDSTIDTDDQPLSAVAVTPCGRMLATGQNTVVLWDVISRQKIRELATHETTVESIRFSPDGTRVASASRYDDVKVCSIEGELERELDNGARNESLSFSPDGRQLLIPNRSEKGDDDYLSVFQLDSGDCSVNLRPSNYTTCGTFSDDGDMIVAGERYKNRITLFEADPVQEIMSLPPHRDQLNAVATLGSTDDLVIAAAYNDGVVTYYCKLAPRDETWVARSIKAHESKATFVQFINQERLVSCGKDGLVKVWNVAGSDRARRIELGANVQDLAISPDGEQLAVACANGLWLGKPTNKHDATIQGQGGQMALRAVAYSPRGDRLATCAKESSRINLWDAAGGESIGYLEHENGAVHDVDFSPEGNHLASTGEDSKVRIWDVAGFREVDSLDLPDHGWAVVYSPNGQSLAMGGQFPEIIVRDSTTSQVRRLNAESTTEDLAFSSDGQVLASAHTDARIRLWDLRSGRLLAELRGHEDCVNALAFSPDGETLASVSSDGTLRLWSVRMQCQFGVVVRRLRAANAVAFTPNGRGVVAGFGAPTNSVVLWEFER